jgi:hypothetical protein
MVVPQRRRRWLSIVILVAALFAGSGAAFASPADGVSASSAPHPVAVGVLAKPRVAAGGSLSAAALEKAQAAPPVVYDVPAGSTAEAYAALLMATGDYEYAAPDFIRTLDAYTALPNDPDFRDNAWWSFSGVAVPRAKSWPLRGAGSSNFDLTWADLAVDGTAYHARATAAQVPVAVIDSGFYMTHPDKGDIVGRKDCLQSYSYVTGRVTDLDVTPAPATAPLNNEEDAAHGTLVASLIAQAPDNGVGSTGAGYDAKVYVYKVQGIWAEGDPVEGYPEGCAVILDSAVIDAIRSAADDGCRVISMSLGSPDPSTAIQSAIDYAWGKGAVVVSTAGNRGTEGLNYPGAANHVIGVGSAFTDSVGTPSRSDFSCYGTGLDIMAPGEGIWGPTRPGYDADGAGTSCVPGYAWWEGTSMAAPLVSAAAATIIRMAPDLTPDEVAGILTASATDMGAAGYDTMTGWGLLNAHAAVHRLMAEYPLLAAPALSGVTEGAGYAADAALTLTWTPVAGHQVTYTVRGDWTATPLYSGTATSAVLTDVPDGDRHVTVTPTSTRNWSDASSVASVGFTMNPPPPVMVLTLAASTSGVGYGGAVSLSGTLSYGASPSAGETVVVERSWDETTWSAVATTTADSTGAWTWTGVPGRTTAYRASFAGSADSSPAVSSVVTVGQLSYMTPPVPTVARVYRGRLVGVQGLLLPGTTAGSTSISVGFYRLERRRVAAYRYRSGRRVRYYRYVKQWVLHRTVAATAYDYAGYTRYYAVYKFPERGSWLTVAAFPGDTRSLGASSPGCRVLVR